MLACWQTLEASTATSGFRDRVTYAWMAVRDAGATIIPAKVGGWVGGGVAPRPEIVVFDCCFVVVPLALRLPVS